LGDSSALDRLATLSSDLRVKGPSLPDTLLIAAQVASTLHRFADARQHLQDAAACGAPEEALNRVGLVVQQALGENLPAVLAMRRKIADATGTPEDLVPLGALLADMGEFEAANSVYERAIRQYRDVSPFALAWVCFQLGVLWGEMVPEPDGDRAADWYRCAIAYLPPYALARIHLAEIRLDAGRHDEAEKLLLPVVGCGDPEVRWRLAEAMAAQGRVKEAGRHLEVAHRTFERLLTNHELAFADHAAAFYLGTGSDVSRACHLARLNLENRPTLRAFELAYRTAIRAGEETLARELVGKAKVKWQMTNAFAYSPLAKALSSQPEPDIARGAS
jgi:tetratricopeptide (TPR) repeat protein